LGISRSCLRRSNRTGDLNPWTFPHTHDLVHAQHTRPLTLTGTHSHIPARTHPMLLTPTQAQASIRRPHIHKHINTSPTRTHKHTQQCTHGPPLDFSPLRWTSKAAPAAISPLETTRRNAGLPDRLRQRTFGTACRHARRLTRQLLRMKLAPGDSLPAVTPTRRCGGCGSLSHHHHHHHHPGPRRDGPCRQVRISRATLKTTCRHARPCARRRRRSWDDLPLHHRLARLWWHMDPARPAATTAR